MPALSSSLLANKKISAANTIIGIGISSRFGGFNSFLKTIFAFFMDHFSLIFFASSIISNAYFFFPLSRIRL